MSILLERYIILNLLEMKNLDKNEYHGFTGYEDARIATPVKKVKKANPKAVKAALNRINPDENTQDRG